MYNKIYIEKEFDSMIEDINLIRLNYYIQTEDKCGWIPDEFAYSGVDWSYKDTMFNYRNWDTRFHPY